MGKKAHQHVLPQFYQRYFSHKNNNKDFIWAHEFGQKPKEISIRDSGVKRHAYSTKKTFKSEYDTSNEDALGLIEGLISPLYEKIVLTKTIDNLSIDERNGFALFVILMSERTTNNFTLTDQMMRDLHVECWAEGIKKITDNEMREAFEKAKKEKAEIYEGTTFEQAKEWMIQGPKQENIVYTHSHGISNMWQAAITCFPFLVDLDWQLLEPANGVEQFCTSDDPVVNMIMQSDGARIVKGGWGQPSLEVIFPMTPKLCFGASKGAKRGVYAIDQAAIDSINKSTVLQAYKYAYTQELIDIQKYLTVRANVSPDYTKYESFAPKRKQ